MVNYTHGAALLALATGAAAGKSSEPLVERKTQLRAAQHPPPDAKKRSLAQRKLYASKPDTTSHDAPTYWPTYAPTPDEWAGSTSEDGEAPVFGPASGDGASGVTELDACFGARNA